MSSKVCINVTVKLVIILEETQTIDDVINDMNYDFSHLSDKGLNSVVETEITDYQVIN